ncbi:MAG: hypothetical protein AAGA30_20585 [Planctomycetota bacterium]
MSLDGQWESVAVDGFHQSYAVFNFKEKRFKILKPGVFEVKLHNDDIVYGVYVRDGNLLYYNESHPWCACPEDIEDLNPAVKWDAPLSAEDLYRADMRVTRYMLRLQRDETENEIIETELKTKPLQHSN